MLLDCVVKTHSFGDRDVQEQKEKKTIMWFFKGRILPNLETGREAVSLTHAIWKDQHAFCSKEGQMRNYEEERLTKRSIFEIGISFFCQIYAMILASS